MSCPWMPARTMTRRSFSDSASIARHRCSARSRASVRRLKSARHRRVLDGSTSRLSRASAPPVRALPIERHAPRHPHEPGPEPVAVAQLAEAAIRLGERLLRDVLGVFAIAGARCRRRETPASTTRPAGPRTPGPGPRFDGHESCPRRQCEPPRRAHACRFTRQDAVRRAPVQCAGSGSRLVGLPLCTLRPVTPTTACGRACPSWSSGTCAWTRWRESRAAPLPTPPGHSPAGRRTCADCSSAAASS